MFPWPVLGTVSWCMWHSPRYYPQSGWQLKSWSQMAEEHLQDISEIEQSLSLHFIAFVSYPNHSQAPAVIAGRCSSHEAPNCAQHKEAALFIDSGWIFHTRSSPFPAFPPFTDH